MSMKTHLTLYHGSPEIISEPKYGLGNLYNDYGRGFYCTEFPELAKEWACRDNEAGFANQYELDTSSLSVLHLNKEYSVLNWLAVLVENRPVTLEDGASKVAADFLREYYSIDVSGYDLIVGYRVDDRYYNIVRRFFNNNITLETLTEAMALGKLGEQIVLKSEKSFECITYLDSQDADPLIYFPLYEKRMADANRKLDLILQSRSPLDGKYIIDIIREEKR
ncbi:MAG: DUF3990 domain-containing protein [archaeon]|nr:DUF3990 domain-containing protein [archaeon]